MSVKQKIKFIYLREPNPIGEDVIGFFGDIPKELGLDEFVDYKLQFEKSFFEPLQKHQLDNLLSQY